MGLAGLGSICNSVFGSVVRVFPSTHTDYCKDFRYNLPNHLQVEPRYYHSDGSKITLLLWRWQYHGGGSKKSSIAQKAQNCQIHSEMEEKFFTATAMVLPRPRKQCNFTSITVVLPRLYQQMIWRIISTLRFSEVTNNHPNHWQYPNKHIFSCSIMLLKIFLEIRNKVQFVTRFSQIFSIANFLTDLQLKNFQHFLTVLINITTFF